MEGRAFLFAVLSVNLILFAFATEDESSTENAVSFEEESNTGATVSKRTRSLSMGENVNIVKSESRRNPKFGFTVPLPNIPGMDSITNTTPNPTPDTHIFGGLTGEGSTASLGTTALLIKGGVLSGLMALKAAVLPPIFLGALILFLFAGAGFFTCNIINCNRLIGDIAGPSFGPGFGGLPPFNPFTRNGLDDYDQTRPVFQAIDDGYKKYN